MEWHNGDVTGAISTAKNKSAVLVVLIGDESGMAAKLRRQLSDLEIYESAPVIALYIVAGSEAAEQFSAYYPITSVPSAFVVEPATGACLLKDATLAAAVSVCVRHHSAPASAPDDGLSPQERADALQERLRERNVERLEQEETDHAKGMKGEAERRRALQDLVKIKREREQMEAMKAAEEIKRDRVDARRRNEEAKRKYADDKVRRQREQKGGMLDGGASASAPVGGGLTPAEKRPPKSAKTTSASDPLSCRLAFRFPDRSVLKAPPFPGGALLADAFAVVKASGRITTSFQLVASFPHRVYTQAGAASTLRELGLCPSAQLLVQPTVQLDGSNQPRDHGAAPAVSLCERVMAWVFSLLPGAAAASVAIAGQRQPDAVGQKPQQSQPQHQQRQQRRQQQRRQQQPPQSGGPPGGGNHRAQGGSGDIRRRTANQRVARFRNSMDDQGESDKKQAYNGNSLQFEQ